MKPNTPKQLADHIQVMNVKNYRFQTEALSIYCGRGSAKPGMINGNVGNPYEIPRDGDRQEVCRLYRDQILDKFGVTDASPKAMHHHDGCKKILELALTHPEMPVHLYCWCAPLNCHVSSIKTWLFNELGKAWGINGTTVM